MKRRMVALMVCFLAGALMLTGCGSGKKPEQADAAPKQITMKLGLIPQEGTALHSGSVKFAELIDQKTNGRIKIDVYANSALGGNRELVEAIQNGSVELALSGMPMLSGFTKNKTAVFDLPYLFENDAAAAKVLDGEIGQSMFKEMESAGIIGLAYFTQGWRTLSNRDREIRTPADVKGLKIRVLPNELAQKHITALGGSPVNMAYAELYTGLQQKVVDGQDNPYVNVFLMGFHEVQGYITENMHYYDPVPLIMSKIAWDKLSSEEQKIFRDTADEIKVWQREVAAQVNQDYKQKILESGKTKIIELTPQQRQAFKDAAKSCYDEFEDQEMLNKVLAAQK